MQLFIQIHIFLVHARSHVDFTEYWINGMKWNVYSTINLISCGKSSKTLPSYLPLSLHKLHTNNWSLMLLLFPRVSLRYHCDSIQCRVAEVMLRPTFHARTSSLVFWQKHIAIVFNSPEKQIHILITHTREKERTFMAFCTKGSAKMQLHQVNVLKNKVVLIVYFSNIYVWPISVTHWIRFHFSITHTFYKPQPDISQPL